MKIFSFDKRDVLNLIQRELKTFSKFKEPFNYIVAQLSKHGNSLNIKSLDDTIDLNKVKENKGKNYFWSVFTHKNVTILVRRYGHHLTIYTKIAKKSDDDYENTEYGSFSFNSKTEKLENCDEYNDMLWSNPFKDLNIVIKDLIVLITERNVQSVWNEYSLPRPEHVKVIFTFDEHSISSLDQFVFCMEEISTMYMQLFSENTVLKQLKTLDGKEGEMISDIYKLKEVRTNVKDEYFHNAGITVIDVNNNNKEKWMDVYSISMWYCDLIFKEKLYSMNGVFYVPGGKIKDGGVVGYKNEKWSTAIIYKETYPKENFISLKKL